MPSKSPSTKPRQRHRAANNKQYKVPSDPTAASMPPRTLDTTHAMSSSLDNVQHINPRTPRGNRSFGYDTTEEDEVELTLLGEEERRQAALGLEEARESKEVKRPLSARDKRAMVLLSVLCMCAFFVMSAVIIPDV
jgi:hypothetical protein